jgi:hypothetical protein
MADITQMAARSGKVIRSDNTIVNEADGINDDGSRRVQLTGSSVVLVNESNFTTYEAGASRYFDLSGDFKTLLVAYRGTAVKVSIGAVSINTSNNFGQGVIPFTQQSSKNLSTYYGNYIEIPMLNPNKTRVYVQNDDTSAKDLAIVILGRK